LDVTEVAIRTMSRSELSFAVDEAARELWNPGRQDAQAFYAADPDGFIVAELAGRPIGCVSAVRYGSGYGFLGLFIVIEEFRGRGVGMRLWDAATSRLDGRIAGLDGVLAMQAAYARSGFALSHRNIRFCGPVMRGRVPVVDVEPLVDLDELCAYDEPLFGGPRRDFLAAWLGQDDAVALGARQQGELHGFVVARACLEGTKIGPLFADDPAIAESLLDAVKATLPEGATVIMDVPEPNAMALALAEANGMIPVFETARMYRGGDPGLPIDRVFGITTFELG
jgi:GNAT superfamily N-acetyltransferase